jgi:hypothetical protein
VLLVSQKKFGHTESLKDITASVGFTQKADFMRRQDEGGWHTPQSGENLKIPTDAARQGGVKTGLLQRGYGYRKNARKMIIKLGIAHGVGTEKYRYVRRAAVAYKSGMLRYAGEHNSLFRVTKFHNIGKGKYRKVVFDQKLIFNRKYPRTYTPAHNFFMPACQKAAKDLQKIFNKHMEKAVGGK